MNYNIRPFSNGPLGNNTYLVSDPESRQAIVIDPSLDCLPLISYLDANKMTLQQIWITHAHFDHTIGIKNLLAHFSNQIQIALHRDDLDLWNSGGGGQDYGFQAIYNPPPNLLISDGQILTFGETQWQVLHTPGHTRGCVVYYCAELKAAFCGDLMFRGSIGKTDLPGGNFDQLLESIQSKILPLPEETRLFPGHGEETTVGFEKATNPFLT